MLARDFEGQQSARELLWRATPAFGNDVAEVDEIAARIYDTFVEAILGYESRIGALHSPQMFSYTSHVRAGEMTAATPNGRRAGTTFSDGIGPSQGKDVSGPTCLINSVTRLDHSRLAGGCGFNLKLSPSLVGGSDGREVLKSLIRAYLRRGGSQIQINLVGQEALRQAQLHPEDYRHIVVRVAGFCEYFTNLDRKLQNEIIERTSQQTVGA